MHESPGRFHPRRRWGQNFLVNQRAADTIVAAFDPRPADLALEIGPGRGVLTRRLLGRVGRLLAIEVDPALAAHLREDLGARPDLDLLEDDVLRLDLRAVLARLGATSGRPARAIANLPYNIGTAVILRLLDERDLLADILVLVQREVAERIVSPPGVKSYGSLSVLCQSRARVERLLRLRPGSFRPAPRVDSELVRLTPDRLPPCGPPGGLEDLLRHAFAQRRKTLLNNLERLPSPQGNPLGSAAAERLIRSAGLDPGARPEAIGVDGYRSLLRARAGL